MAQDTTDPKKSNKPLKKRYRTNIAGVAINSGIFDGAMMMANIIEKAQRDHEALLRAALPFVVESDRDDFPGILIDDDDTAPLAKQVDAPPASDRGPGERHKQNPQSAPAVAKPRAGVQKRKSRTKRLTDKQRKLVENFYAAKDTIDFPGVGVWARLKGFSERHLLRLRDAYDEETPPNTVNF